MPYLSPYHRELLDRRKPLNWFAAMILRSNDEPPFPWSGTSRPLTDDFAAKSQANQWFQVHGLIAVDPSCETQRWIWTPKGHAYREAIKAANIGHHPMLRDFPDVPTSEP